MWIKTFQDRQLLIKNRINNKKRRVTKKTMSSIKLALKTSAHTLPSPQRPTAKEVEEHNATHLPYRSWCPVCVKARVRKIHTTRRQKRTKKVDFQEFASIMQQSELTLEQEPKR